MELFSIFLQTQFFFADLTYLLVEHPCRMENEVEYGTCLSRLGPPPLSSVERCEEEIKYKRGKSSSSSTMSPTMNAAVEEEQQLLIKKKLFVKKMKKLQKNNSPELNAAVKRFEKEIKDKEKSTFSMGAAAAAAAAGGTADDDDDDADADACITDGHDHPRSRNSPWYTTNDLFNRLDINQNLILERAEIHELKQILKTMYGYDYKLSSLKLKLYRDEFFISGTITKEKFHHFWIDNFPKIEARIFMALPPMNLVQTNDHEAYIKEKKFHHYFLPLQSLRQIQVSPISSNIIMRGLIFILSHCGSFLCLLRSWFQMVRIFKYMV